MSNSAFLDNLGIKEIDTVIDTANKIFREIQNSGESVYISDKPIITESIASDFANMDRPEDDDLKILLANSMSQLRNLKRTEQLSWAGVKNVFSRNKLLSLDPRTRISERSRLLINDGVNILKFDGAASNQNKQKVKDWYFDKLLAGDHEVRKKNKLNIGEFASIAGETGVRVSDFLSFFHDTRKVTRNAIDIGVIRFPDPENMFVKIYRIKLTAWTFSKRTLFVQDDNSGIKGEFDRIHFNPRPDVLKEIKRKHMPRVDEIIDELFPI